MDSMQLTEDISELLGFHAGDGSLYKTAHGLVWELRGGNDEKEFYDKYIISLLKKITNINFKAHHRSGGKNGCYGLRSCKKEFIKIFLNFGFNIGNKTKTVTIPDLVMAGSKTMKSAFLRGLIATDGTAYLAKINNADKNNYPIIEFCSTSEKLRNQTNEILHEFGLNSYIWTYKSKKGYSDAFYLRLSGKNKCVKFKERIGLVNFKHESRLQDGK